MFYDPIANKHGLKHDPWKAIVAPRPIGWISTVGPDAVCNLAPYSFFNAVSERPPYVMFCSSGMKDSIRNIHDTGEFVCSLATYGLRYNMNMTSAPVPRGVDEFRIGELTAAPCRLVRPPRVKESPVAIECRHWKTVDLPPATPGGPAGYHVVFGQVVGIHIDEAFIREGIVDTAAMRPIARLGYMEYAVVTAETVFSINRPTAQEAMAVLAPAGPVEGSNQ
jgi:flavin reductase (DIM6/NTAB) family NADH-FMN oxidoreductase RutF